jgi:hypothetical protein
VSTGAETNLLENSGLPVSFMAVPEFSRFSSGTATYFKRQKWVAVLYSAISPPVAGSYLKYMNNSAISKMPVVLKLRFYPAYPWPVYKAGFLLRRKSPKKA